MRQRRGWRRQPWRRNAAGGYLRGRQKYLSNFGWILEDGPFPKGMLGRANTYPESRLPREICVNAHGQRFIREDEPSVDVREHALLDQPELRYWIVFDDAIFRKARRRSVAGPT